MKVVSDYKYLRAYLENKLDWTTKNKRHLQKTSQLAVLPEEALIIKVVI